MKHVSLIKVGFQNPGSFKEMNFNIVVFFSGLKARRAIAVLIIKADEDGLQLELIDQEELHVRCVYDKTLRRGCSLSQGQS